jgi:succinyl-diaminopimelate desuccinylase
MKDLLIKLVRAQTTAQKGELSAAEVVLSEFGRSMIDARIDSWSQSRANIIAHIRSADTRPALLFACHLDIVGPGEEDWKYPPFDGVENNGKIYGRGAADMKGGIAAAVTAISQTVEAGVSLQGDIIFLGAAGEETDSCGAKRFVAELSGLAKVGGVIIPEPTDFQIVTAHRGMLWLEITTKGKAAHSSSPQLGVNAIILMKDILAELDNFRIPFEPHPAPIERSGASGLGISKSWSIGSSIGAGLGGCSMSINTITGGQALNVVPDKCSIGIDIRTIPSQNHQDIINALTKIFTKLRAKNPQFNADISIIREVGPLETDSNCDFVRDLCSVVGVIQTKAIGFTTDGPYFASLGAPVVIFGPGKPELCHKPDEYIEISDVEKAVEYYKKIILKFLT